MRTADRLRLGTARNVSVYFQLYPPLCPVTIEAVFRLDVLLQRVTVLLERRRALEQEIASAHEGFIRAAHPLRQQLFDLMRLGRAIAPLEPALGPAPRIPTGAVGRQEFLFAAELLLAQIAEHRMLFLQYGMSPAAFEEASRGLAGYRAAEERRLNATDLRATILEEIVSLARQSVRIVHHLDALMRSRLRAQPARLAEWTRARAIPWHRRNDSDAGDAMSDLEV